MTSAHASPATPATAAAPAPVACGLPPGLRRLAAAANLSVCALAAAAAGTQTPGDAVLRCGPDGRSYSGTACPQGQPVAVDDARTPQQQQQAREAAQRERALADRMSAERLAQASQPAAGPINLTPGATTAPAAAGAASQAKPGHGKAATHRAAGAKKRKPDATASHASGHGHKAGHSAGPGKKHTTAKGAKKPSRKPGHSNKKSKRSPQ